MHKQFEFLLQQYIDLELNALEVLLLEEHLVTCQNCRQELNQLKLIDWDLKHQPVVEIPPELETYRINAIKNYLADVEVVNEKETSPYKPWYLQQHILQHTFSFISYNPINRIAAQSAKKTVSIFAMAAGKSIKKRSPLFKRFIPGQI